jgi:filamentous hemagglutinin
LYLARQQNTRTSASGVFGFGLSLCIPPFCYGTTVSGNLSASKQEIDHNYLSAVVLNFAEM